MRYQLISRWLGNMNKSHALQSLIDDHLRRRTGLLDQRDQHRASGNYKLAEVCQIRAGEVQRSIKQISEVKKRR